MTVALFLFKLGHPSHDQVLSSFVNFDQRPVNKSDTVLYDCMTRAFRVKESFKLVPHHHMFMLCDCPRGPIRAEAVYYTSYTRAPCPPWLCSFWQTRYHCSRYSTEVELFSRCLVLWTAVPTQISTVTHPNLQCRFHFLLHVEWNLFKDFTSRKHAIGWNNS